MNASDILSFISKSYNPEYYNSNRMDDLSEYLLHKGGASRNMYDNIEFKENYSGDKEDKRLVYLINFDDNTVVTKLSKVVPHYLVEKDIYQYFNKKTKDLVVKNHVLRTYDTQTYPNEYLDEPEPYIVLPCKVNGKVYNLKLSNDIVPINDKGQPFLNTNENTNGTYNYLKTKYDTCLYIVLEVRPTFTILKDYVKGEANPEICKRLFIKTVNLLNHLNNMYGFNHWDLHYHNLMVYVSPNKVNGRSVPTNKRTVDVCFLILILLR